MTSFIIRIRLKINRTAVRVGKLQNELSNEKDIMDHSFFLQLENRVNLFVNNSSPYTHRIFSSQIR